jgi:hypothetical protein
LGKQPLPFPAENYSELSGDELNELIGKSEQALSVNEFDGLNLEELKSYLSS